MRENKRRIETFTFFDHTGIEKHLEEMAAKGWMLSRINRFTWEYRSIEPKALKFAVTYYPKASEFDPEPLEEQLIYRDYSERSGWMFICSSAQMQIFYNEKENPVPMETDPSIEVDVIHRSAKKSFLLSNYFLLAMAILQIVMFLLRLSSDPVKELSSGINLATGACWILVFVICVVELAGYYIWRNKALKAAMYGEFLKTNGHTKFLKTALIITILLAFYTALNLVSSGDETGAAVYVLVLVCMFVLIFIVNHIKQTLKDKKVSRDTNRTITIVVAFVMSFVIIGGIAFGVLKGALAGVFRQSNEGNIPLKIEDLLEIDYSDYINENRREESIFLGRLQVWQWPYQIDDTAFGMPGLQYTITTVKVPFLYDFCKNSIVNDPPNRLDSEGNRIAKNYETADPAPWKALEVYQLYWDDEKISKYILCYENRLIEIEFDWEPTDEQKGIVAEKL